MRKLLESKEIGDRKPSQFYPDLRKLASSSIPDDFIFTLWRNRLLDYIKHVLAAMDDTKAENLTRATDRIHKAHSEKGRIAAVGTERMEGEQQSHISDTLDDRLSRIEAQNEVLSLNHRRYQRSSLRHRRSNSRDRPQNSGLCYYHAIFEDRARNCRNPCNWTQRKRKQLSVNMR